LVWRLRFRVGLLRFGVAKWREREEEAAGIEKSAVVEKKLGRNEIYTAAVWVGIGLDEKLVTH